MRYFISLLFSISICSLHGYSQSANSAIILLKGLVTDQATNLPLAYASVGILDKPLGTVSDSNGHFFFSILEENKTDTLQISLVGYETKKIPVNELLNVDNQTISLSRKDYTLPVIVISNRNYKTEILGRKSSSKLMMVSIHNKKSVDETIGSEMGMRFKTVKGGFYLKDLNWYFAANNFNYIKFRVHVYSVKNNMPDTLLSDQQIFAFVEDFKTGWNKFDLLPYNIRVDGDFIITLQWVESRMDKKEDPVTIIPMGMSMNKNAYARVASQDKWKRMGFNLSYYVTLIQE